MVLPPGNKMAEFFALARKKGYPKTRLNLKIDLRSAVDSFEIELGSFFI
jgi:hypothetical protein